MRDKFGVEPVTSHEMEQSTNLWYSLYVGHPPWESDTIRPLGIPAAICRELARPVLVEFSADISGSQRADYLAEQFANAQEHFIQDLEMALALGGIAFRPYRFGDSLLVDATGPAGFQPTKFDASGRCIGGVFKDKPVRDVDNKYYIRLEYHDLDGTTYTIQNKAFRSDKSGTIGSEVELSTVEGWAGLEPVVTIENLDGPLFAYFRVPQSNNVDSGPAGVSVYSNAVDLIRQADEQWADLRWEYRSGKRKIFTDGGALRQDFDAELFQRAPYTGQNGLFEQFSPEFRDEALYRGFQNILKLIEYNTGLSYGDLSDVQTVAMTATEIRASKQRKYITVETIKTALGHTFDALLYAMDVFCTLYPDLGVPAGGYDVAYDWGDSVLDDEETKTARNADMRLDVQSGLLRGDLYISKKYGVTEEEAREMMPGMEELTEEVQNELE